MSRKATYEYKVEWVIGSNAANPSYMESWLNAMGGYGWELCTGVSALANGNVFFYFKRRLQ